MTDTLGRLKTSLRSGQLLECGGDVFSVGAIPKGWEAAPQVEPHPVGDVGGKIAAACKPMTGILGKQGQSSGGDGSEVEPSLRD